MYMSRRTSLAALILTCAIFAAPPFCRIADAEILPEQRQAIEAIIHDYLMQNPDVLIEALKAAEEKATRDSDAKAAVVLKDRRAEVFDDPASPVGGNPQGDVTIVEFFDYRCPYCKQTEPALEALLKRDPKIRVAYKEFPILGPASVYASRVALAARAQDKYAAFHGRMMATKGQIDESVVQSVAIAAGLDWERIQKDLTAPEIELALRRNLALAQALAIRGTPGFVIGNQLADGAEDIVSLTQMVAVARGLALARP